MNAEELSLRWQDHHEALLSVFENLLRSNTLVDCTLAAEGRYLKAHKVVLSACSPYFQLLFKEEGEKHPIIILKDVKFWTLKAVIDFVYCGEVKIRENQLGAFLEVAENLQIKGLGSDSQDESDKEMDPNSPEMTKNTSLSSPNPRKRLRRNRSSVSEGDTYVTDANSQNSNFNSSIRQNHPVDVPCISTSNDTAPAFSTRSNSNSGTSEVKANGSKFEASRYPKASSEKSLPDEDIPVIKVEPDTESYEAKMDFGDDGNEDFIDESSVVNEMDAKSRVDLALEQSNSHPHYTGYRYGEMDSQNPYIPGHHPTQGAAPLPASATPGGEAFAWEGTQPSPVRPELSAPVVAAAAASTIGPRGRGSWPRAPLAHTCGQCLKAFPTPYKLSTHIRTHTGERPFACEVCEKSFRQMTHLRAHEMAVHRLISRRV